MKSREIQDKARDKLYRMLAGGSFSSDDEIYRFLILIVATVFAGTMHVFLCVLTFGMGVGVLGAFNLASVAVYVVSLVALLKKRTYVLSGLLIAIEVILYSLLSTCIIGTGGYLILYYFVLLLMQLTIPYAGGRLRAVVAGVVWVAMMATLLLGEWTTPLVQLGSGMVAMTFFNTQLAFFGIIIELSIGNAIQKMIARYNAARLAEYRSQATTDPLTGLYNRWYAESFFNTLAAEGTERAWCVAMLDIDDFKTVNDSQGHAVGDEVLRSLADTLRGNLRKTDVLFRWGGEEFLLFLADVDLETAAEILDKLRRTIAGGTLMVNGAPVGYTVTIGVAELWPEDIEGCIGRCDARLYAGKAEGKNRVVAEG